MPDFFYNHYYGNTVGEWLTAGGVILGTFVGVKIIYFIFSRVIRRFTERTKSRFDDVLVDLVESPVVAAATIAGVWAGIKTLNLGDDGSSMVDGASLFCFVLCVVWLLTRAIDAVFTEILAPLAARTETDLDDQLLPIGRKGSKIVVWILGVVIALNNAGYNVGAVLAGLGIGGLALAMAAKDTVANVFGGVTVFADRPFRVHDRVRIDGYEGFVREIGIRSTRIQTMDGPMVVIPNSRFSEGQVENISGAPDGLRAECVVGLTYDTSHDQVKKAMSILTEIIEANPETRLWDIGFDSFGDFSLNVHCVYYVIGKRRPLPVKSEVNLAVLERFNAEGLSFAFPTQTLHVEGTGAAATATSDRRSA